MKVSITLFYELYFPSDDIAFADIVCMRCKTSCISSLNLEFPLMYDIKYIQVMLLIEIMYLKI